MSNIFKKLLEADVVLEPFPHVVIEGLIDRNTYTDLEKQFPSGLSIKKYHNSVQDFIAKRLMAGSTIEELGYFIRGLDDSKAKRYIANYQRKAQNKYPSELKLTQNTPLILEFKSLRTVDGLHSFKKLKSDWEDIRLSVLRKFREWIPAGREDNIPWKALEQFSFSRGDVRVNTKVSIEGTTSLGPHIDNSQEIIAGLIYFKSDNDNSDGGDLGLYGLNNGVGFQFMSPKRRIPDEYVNLEKNIRYGKNIAVFSLIL